MRRALPFALLFFVSSAAVYAFGVSESYNDWYGSVAEGSEDVANTGITAFPTLLIPIGGEYEAMGTAYTAVGRDASFIDANPAASSEITETQIALFHNNWIADSNIEGVAYTTRYEDFGVALGGKYLHVPFTEYDDFGVQQETTRYTETIVAANLSYNFLSSFYFTGVAVGANLKLGYRRAPDTHFNRDVRGAGAMVDLGALSRFDLLKFYPSRQRNFSVGTTIKNLGPNVRGDPLPTVWTTGIAYSPIRPLLFAFDLNIPMTPFSPLPSESVGFAVGAAATITDFFIMRSGFLLRGGNPRISMGGSVDFEKMTVDVTYALDMTTQLTAFDRFSVGISFPLGDRGRGAREEQVRTLYLDALEAFAAGDLEQTIDLCRQAIEIDPTFQPAEETLVMATRMLDLQEQMDAIRFGDTELPAGDVPAPDTAPETAPETPADAIEDGAIEAAPAEE